MLMRRINVIIGICSIIFAIAFYTQALGIRPPANYYPMTIIATIGFLGLALLIQNHFKPMAAAFTTPFKGTRWKVIFGTILGSIFYVYLVDVIGFYVASFIFLIIATGSLSDVPSFRGKPFFKLLAMAFVVVGLIYLGFDMFLNVPTPSGLLF
jgi:hypothetical protein